MKPLLLVIAALLAQAHAHALQPLRMGDFDRNPPPRAGTRGLIASPVAVAAMPDCVRGYQPSPSSRGVGVETIHNDSGRIITILLPMPERGQRLLDLNATRFNTAYPERFTMSDGTLASAFISIDLRPRSLLSACVAELAGRVRASGRSTEARLEALRDLTHEFLREVPDTYSFPWDPRRERRLPREFEEAGSLAPGHYPLETSLSHPVIPLEAFLKEGRGACLPKVMLTSLVMKELDIEHRVRAGGTESSGHMWIELPDGRHLDPTWRLLQRPTSRGASPGWFRMDQTYLFENQFFPVTVD